MKALVLVLLLCVPLSAQEPVREVPDVISWGTAAVTPALGVWRATHGPDPMCHLSQLMVSGGLVTSGLLLQRFITSPRPCASACSGNGMPSLHSAFAMVGLSSGWRVGIGFSVATPIGRVAANRHTKTQAAAGSLFGLGAELLSQRLVRCQD